MYHDRKLVYKNCVEFVSQPIDIAILRNEILERIERAKVRSIGLDLTNYLLTIISPKFGCVKAQAIAQLPYALARPSTKAKSHNGKLIKEAERYMLSLNALLIILVIYKAVVLK